MFKRCLLGLSVFLLVISCFPNSISGVGEVKLYGVYGEAEEVKEIKDGSLIDTDKIFFTVSGRNSEKCKLYYSDDKKIPVEESGKTIEINRRYNTLEFLGESKQKSIIVVPELRGKYGQGRVFKLKTETAKIVFKANSGAGIMGNSIVVKNSMIKLNKNIFTKDDYAFKCWTGSDGNSYSDEQNITVTDDLILIAEWVELFTVSFIPNGASGVMSEQIVKKDSTIKLNKNMFTKDNYAFKFWSGSDGNSYSDEQNITVTDDLILIAEWVELFTVSFIPNGASGVMSEQIVKKDSTIKLNKNMFTKDNYAFKFWSGSDGNSYTDEQNIIVTEDLELTAEWVELFTVSFSVDGANGSVVASYDGNNYNTSIISGVPINTEVTFTAIPETDYVVDNWTITGGEIINGGEASDTESVVRIIEDVTVSVSFTLKKYNVTFYDVGGNGSLKAICNGIMYNPQIIFDVPVNRKVIFTATADAGYEVDSWTITGGSFSSGGEAGNTTAVVVVNSNLSVRVSFSSALSEKSFDVGGVSFLMKKIDAVTGTTLGDSGQSRNQPHQVSLSKYFIGETEVTQELWEEVMGDNPSFFDNTGIKTLGFYDYDTAPDTGEVQEKRPVEKVSWFDCIAFCNELTKKVYGEGTKECLYYDSDDNTVYTLEDAIEEKVPSFDINSIKKGFRLPTEAEWEYAAKGGEGYIYSGSGDINSIAWWGHNSNNKTHEVKKKDPNAYGLYDMSGNLWEWCFDSINSYSTSQPASGDNPIGLSGSNRLRRGGSYDYGAVGCVLAFRQGGYPSLRLNATGFRLAGRF